MIICCLDLMSKTTYPIRQVVLYSGAEKVEKQSSVYVVNKSAACGVSML